jgi:crotonobetainyl-CoA:carnitine CoA-transferase CaiB-like acyl-CoA transferase
MREPAIMKGIKVLELSTWAFVPTAAAVLAAWGADVIKVEEPLHGDTMRGLTSWGVGPRTTPAGHPLVHAFNRGKRSIGLNVASDQGHDVLMRLVDQSDIFLTNLLPPARRKLRVDVDDIRGRNPRIIYGRGSAQGTLGPERDKGGFDAVSYWSRSGAARAAMSAGQAEPVASPGPAFGDTQSGMNLAGGLAAALFHRERTGEAATVDVSLLGSGMWAMQPGITSARFLDVDDLPAIDRKLAPNPLVNVYVTSDHRFVSLAMLESDRYWPGLCEALGRDDLTKDPRFLTAELRGEHRGECIAELDHEFGKRTLAESRETLDRQSGQWDVVQAVRDLEHDPQAVANGYIGYLEHFSGEPIPFVRVPIRFDETPEPLAFAPEHAAHTEEVLLELGYDWSEVVKLKESGATT